MYLVFFPSPSMDLDSGVNSAKEMNPLWNAFWLEGQQHSSKIQSQQKDSLILLQPRQKFLSWRLNSLCFEFMLSKQYINYRFCFLYILISERAITSILHEKEIIINEYTRVLIFYECCIYAGHPQLDPFWKHWQVKCQNAQNKSQIPNCGYKGSYRKV